MNKTTLRLLLWEDCNRKCPGCCNKDWDLTKLPVCWDFSPYKEILLTGGEPMLYPAWVAEIIRHIRSQTNASIYMYTAETCYAEDLVSILYLLDGITVTLHSQWDVQPFLYFAAIVKNMENKSRRVNVFEGVNLTIPEDWEAKTDVRWIKNCPLPDNEVFMRYALPPS